MDDIFGDLEGVVNISDDAFVFGTDEADHDKNLAKLMDRFVKNHGVYNYDICEIKKPAITFFGNHYNAMSITPDPPKSTGNHADATTTKHKRNYNTFLGLMNYLAQFLPKFSEKAHDLRDC